ncbi:MAG: AEC family transporter [Chloroflexota bacterium]
MGRVFLEVVLPVALVAIAGGLVGSWRKVALQPVSALVFYLFSPMLVFHSLATTHLSAGASLRIIGVMLATYIAMFVVSIIYSMVRRHEASMRAGFALAATSPNAGNMGLPVAMLAFGQAGFDVAVMNFVAGAILANSGGIAIASMASGGSRLEALRAPFRYPSVYAALAGAVVNVFHLQLPPVIDTPVATLAAAAVPVMLVVLGLQLKQAVGLDRLPDLIALNVVRLTVAPVVAWFVASALGLEGISRGTLVVLSAMPTAVIATIVATEFGAQPTFVTRAVVTTTIVAMASLTVLITLVR